MTCRTRAILVSIVYKFMFILSPHIWREIRGGVFTPLEKVQTEYAGGVGYFCLSVPSWY